MTLENEVESPQPEIPSMDSSVMSLLIGVYSSAPMSGVVVERRSPSMSVVKAARGVPRLFGPPFTTCKSDGETNTTAACTEFTLSNGKAVCHALSEVKLAVPK